MSSEEMKLTNEIVIEKANQLGFDLVGFAKAEELTEETANLQKWIEMKYHGNMEYMQRNLDKRKDISTILPDAKSAISLAINYYTSEKYIDDPSLSKISRYAWGKDYHLIIWEKLEQLETKLKELDPSFKSLSYVDTGPVMDKAWAVKAGLGWLGKHTNVINKEFGSWIFLATIITNYEFDYSSSIPDFCGSCTACIDACPTEAIVAEYILDANRCISYLTIENKGDIPDSFRDKFDDWLFGCDICQDVCPWNIKFSTVTNLKEFHPLKSNKQINPDEVLDMNEVEFSERFKESPVKRAKLKGLKRNAAFLKNVGV
jgi:epoxyqueuosine reductase